MADETSQRPDETDEEEIAGSPADAASETEEVSPEDSKMEEKSSEDLEAEESDTPQDAAPEPKTQRRRESRDIDASGTVTIDGKAFPLRDWSSSGFGIFSCDLEFEDHARVGIDVNVTHSSGELSFSCKAIIVRSDAVSSEVAGAFVEMRREDRIAVTAYFDALEEQ